MRIFVIFFFNDTATTEIYTLSLHDALPISPVLRSTAPSSPNVLTGLPVFASSSISRPSPVPNRSEEHTSELQSRVELVCRLLLEKKKPANSPRLFHRAQHRAVRVYPHRASG